jgi:hypothetical protein
MFNSVTPKQLAFCVSYGLALWLGAIFLVRAIGPMGAFSGWGLIISFVALIPGTIPAVLLTRRVMGPLKDQMLMGVTIISTIALLLAAIGFSFFPTLYGSNMTQVLAASGFMMWGGGIGFVLALMIGKDR